MKASAWLVFVSLLVVSQTAWAAGDFDGTKTLVCATTEAIIFEPGQTCEKGLPEKMGAPEHVRVDFGKKVIVGSKRMTEIRLMEKNNEQITLQGSNIDFGWTLVISRQTGKMTATITGQETVVVRFGTCTALE
jgi:hypothetical protein